MPKTADEIVSHNPMSGIYTRLYECLTLKQNDIFMTFEQLNNNNNNNIPENTC